MAITVATDGFALRDSRISVFAFSRTLTSHMYTEFEGLNTDFSNILPTFYSGSCNRGYTSSKTLP